MNISLKMHFRILSLIFRIPYQLIKPADVSITIYNVSGKAVRLLIWGAGYRLLQIKDNQLG